MRAKEPNARSLCTDLRDPETPVHSPGGGGGCHCVRLCDFLQTTASAIAVSNTKQASWWPVEKTVHGNIRHVCSQYPRAGKNNIAEGDPHGSVAPVVTCGAIKSRSTFTPDGLSAV